MLSSAANKTKETKVRQVHIVEVYSGMIYSPTLAIADPCFVSIW